MNLTGRPREDTLKRFGREFGKDFDRSRDKTILMSAIDALETERNNFLSKLNRVSRIRKWQKKRGRRQISQNLLNWLYCPDWFVIKDMHESLFDYLKQNSNLGLVELRGNGVHINNRAGFRFEIVIPDSVFEWYVDAYDDVTGEKVWSDWADWYPIKGGPPLEELLLLYEEDVKYFISRLLSANDFRISRSPGVKVFWWTLFSTKQLEGKIGDAWHVLKPGALPDKMGKDKYAA